MQSSLAERVTAQLTPFTVCADQYKAKCEGNQRLKREAYTQALSVSVAHLYMPEELRRLHAIASLIGARGGVFDSAGDGLFRVRHLLAPAGGG